MRSTGKTGLREEGGLALIATLMVVVMVGAIIAAGVHTAINVTRASISDHQGSRAFYAAEASAEAAMSQLEIALQDGVITNAELAGIQPPEP